MHTYKLEPMFKHLTHSLLFRLGLVMTAIIALAMLGAASSLLIADAIEGEADGVNLAGSLRMQSYRIATNLVYDNSTDIHSYQREMVRLVDEFERRLYSNMLVKVLPVIPDDPLRAAYHRVEVRWQEEIRPLLDIYLAGILPAEGTISPGARTNLRARYLQLTPLFVDDIDRFVDLLAKDAEAKIDRLRAYQIVTLLVMLLMAILALYLTHQQVHTPLRSLLRMAEKAGRGDFSIRTPYHGEDELGRLGRAFNLMAEDLDRLYRDLEARVDEKTADLERSKRSLELLYRTVRKLNAASARPAAYTALLHDIEVLAETGPGMICFADYFQDGASMLASTCPQDNEKWHPCGSGDCCTCLSEGGTRIMNLAGEDGTVRRMIATPISDQSRRYGVLLMQLPEDRELEVWQRRLLETVANHIGIALTLSRQATEHRRLALLEERGVIARELHDSLAQALSYLKIQVTRLESSLGKPGDDDGARAIISELREGLGSAYRELRELLTTFRLRMDEQDLCAALEATTAEFARRSPVNITLDYRIRHNELNANEEIHLLHIVREALSNVINHARASECRVRLQQEKNGELSLSVDDDGEGFPASMDKPHHYGLTIMRERTRSLAGEVSFGTSELGGARVALIFTPALRRTQNGLQQAAGS